MNGDKIIEAARTWINTPFHHQSNSKGSGCDCLGLIRGVWSDLGYYTISTRFDYPQTWALGDAICLVDGLSRHLIPIPLTEAIPGDVIACKMRIGGPIQHLGILAQSDAGPTMIHAHSRFGVQETPYYPLWVRLARAAFRFPKA